ncbi:MAG: helix-turn-helix domain-containing protein [Alistipes finegoldii]
MGCGRSQVHLWVTLFERHGLAGLKLRHGSYSAEFKLSVLKHMHQNHLSLLETAVHFGIPGPFVIRQWERLYQNQGAEGLRRKPQRRRPAMSKSKTKKSNSKRLRTKSCLRNWSIFVPRMLTKKLQALVEERIVRESGKSPSHRRTKAAVPAFSIAQSRRDGAKHILLSLQKIKTTR